MMRLLMLTSPVAPQGSAPLKLARVGEIAPDIPEVVIAEYRVRFKDGEAKKPIIMNGLDKIAVYRKEVVTPRPQIRVI